MREESAHRDPAGRGVFCSRDGAEFAVGHGWLRGGARELLVKDVGADGRLTRSTYFVRSTPGTSCIRTKYEVIILLNCRSLHSSENATFHACALWVARKAYPTLHLAAAGSLCGSRLGGAGWLPLPRDSRPQTCLACFSNSSSISERPRPALESEYPTVAALVPARNGWRRQPAAAVRDGGRRADNARRQRPREEGEG